MKISLVYLNVVGKATEDAPEPSYYAPFIERFCTTYRAYAPGISHELIIVDCGIGYGVGTAFGMGNRHLHNHGPGWDCGTYQRIAKQLDCDMAVFMATPVYFWREGWLERLALAWSLFGPGLYGPMASYENQPHIRTSCIACAPELLSLWPERIDTHLQCSAFEQAFSLKAITSGGKCKLVTWDGFYDVQDWRKPDNIFRRGDQSACLLWDRHVDIFRDASPEEKVRLANAADGLK